MRDGGWNDHGTVPVWEVVRPWQCTCVGDGTTMAVYLRGWWLDHGTVPAWVVVRLDTASRLVVAWHHHGCHADVGHDDCYAPKT